MFKLLLWIGILWTLYWYFFKRKKPKVSRERKQEVTEMVFDPNCNTYIQKKDAIKVEMNGKVYYFCSKKCMEEYFTRVKSQ